MALSLTLQSQCKYRVGEEFKNGSVYKVFEGTFADYPRVLIKQVPLHERKRMFLARTEVSMMQKLSDFQHITKMFHVNLRSAAANIIVQRYEFNLLQYLSRLVNVGRLTQVYDEPTIFCQVFSGLSYMHAKSIIHGNIKLKNVYIHSASGKFCYYFLSQFIN